MIFTFDGDAAGMKAAERAFGDDQKFVAQTFVAIEPTGLDPCDLRLKSGDTAVRDLVARRIPLVEFVLRTTVARFDLDTAEGRVAAMDAGIPPSPRSRTARLRDEYARRLAGLIGFETRGAGGRPGARAGAGDRPPAAPGRAPSPHATAGGRGGGPRSSARCSRSRCNCPRWPGRSSTRSTRRRS